MTKKKYLVVEVEWLEKVYADHIMYRKIPEPFYVPLSEFKPEVVRPLTAAEERAGDEENWVVVKRSELKMCGLCRNPNRNAGKGIETLAEQEQEEMRFSMAEAADGSGVIEPGKLLKDTHTGEIVGIALTASDAYEIRAAYEKMKKGAAHE